MRDRGGCGSLQFENWAGMPPSKLNSFTPFRYHITVFIMPANCPLARIAFYCYCRWKHFGKQYTGPAFFISVFRSFFFGHRFYLFRSWPGSFALFAVSRKKIYSINLLLRKFRFIYFKNAIYAVTSTFQTKRNYLVVNYSWDLSHLHFPN